MDAKKSKGFKRYVKSMFHVSRWMGTDEIRASYQNVRSIIKIFSKVEQPECEESYEEAIARLALTEDDLLQRRVRCFQIACFYGLLTLLLFAYTLYLFSHGHPLAAFACLPLVMVMSVFFFKYHFWFTQIKHKRLGLSAKAWLVAWLTGVVR
jgi:intracellular multiplication protein IcmV